MSAAAIHGVSIHEENQRSDLLILPVTLLPVGRNILTYAMADTGCEPRGLIDENWARDNGLALEPLKRPWKLRVADSNKVNSG